jgi:anaerobic dimethyl sulfoxide reductase subunit B (iron-sulfur subunit)
MLACKNWNDDKRGDYSINKDSMRPDTDWYTSDTYVVDVNQMDQESFYLNSSGETNYEQNRKYYMKEEWRRVNHNERAYPFPVKHASVACNHCSEPACAKACPMGIIYKEKDYGIVLVNTSGCISCGKCKSSCPWDAPQFYSPDYSEFDQDDPARPKMTKCTLCLDRIKEGLKPACVASCLNRALDAGPIDQLRNKWGGFGKNIVEASAMDPDDFADGTELGPNIIFVKK